MADWRTMTKPNVFLKSFLQCSSFFRAGLADVEDESVVNPIFPQLIDLYRGVLPFEVTASAFLAKGRHHPILSHDQVHAKVIWDSLRNSRRVMPRWI